MNAVAGGNEDGCVAAKEQHSLGQYKTQRSHVDNFSVPFWPCLLGATLTSDIVVDFSPSKTL
jgi:hypothetical protein